ncbi:Sensor histidine kinase RcsC [Sporomusa silvacetica DSM 10669]|uniref:Sensor histidine kinase RcsC n=1 Tax=Sporomusa silvacetica DSM 10669 TaxID=1123289 RepID=A0ABZ3IKW2_9FIRM|nr:response regulator [Sporomusa silvacetica]OZC22732.1 alkaline phosphatase synthesis transcriptional regulatory protein PhoP [Sporomusa silvacetica DSM 10669]
MADSAEKPILLIVDDEPGSVKILLELLRSDYSIRVANDGEKALKIAFADETPDLILLDVMMPRLDGYEVCRKIKDDVRTKHIPVIFITEKNAEVDELKGFEVGAVDYLAKPFRADAVKARVRAHIGLRGPRLPGNDDTAIARLLKLENSSSDTFPDHTAIQIKCLGKFEVRPATDNTPLKWRTAKIKELFAFLLNHHGAFMPRDVIIASLWPEHNFDTVGNNLHTTVYKLKKIVKEAGLNISIEFSNGSYKMNLGDGINCDASSFELLVAKNKTIDLGNLPEFEQAADLYQGDYFAVNDYAWCLAKRSRLQECYSFLIKRLVRYYIDALQYKKAEYALLKYIEYLPYDEDAYESLLWVCFLQGDRAALVKYYRQLELTLKNELGIDPQAALKNLYERCMNDFGKYPV